jgi:hypothetical protein
MKTLLVLTILAGCAATHPAPQLPNATALDLAARRAQMIGWLHDYREAGAYPTDAQGLPRSVFVDDRGVRCPMAWLIHESGRDDLVEAVHREANGVRLAEVHDGPLHDWMLASGLTQEEIALVQGAANIDFMWLRQQEQSFQVASAIAEVRGKLETAEQALRDGTRNGLATAIARVPARRTPAELATARVAGRVVPLAAVPAAPPPQPPRIIGRLGGSLQLDGIQLGR